MTFVHRWHIGFFVQYDSDRIRQKAPCKMEQLLVDQDRLADSDVKSALVCNNKFRSNQVSN